MSHETASNWSNFRGTLPLLALPAAIVMPYSVQPLQLRGPVYRELMQQLQTGNRLLGLTILQPGWEASSNTMAAPVYSHGCLAEVTVQHTSPAGRSVVMVRGVCRMQVDVEQSSGPLRSGEVVAMADRYPSPPAIDRAHRRDELLEAFQQLHELESLELFESLLRHELSLGCLTDLLAQSLPLSPATSAELLSLNNVDYRSDLLLDYLRSELRSASFRAETTFSCN